MRAVDTETGNLEWTARMHAVVLANDIYRELTRARRFSSSKLRRHLRETDISRRDFMADLRGLTGRYTVTG